MTWSTNATILERGKEYKIEMGKEVRYEEHSIEMGNEVQYEEHSVEIGRLYYWWFKVNNVVDKSDTKQSDIAKD